MRDVHLHTHLYALGPPPSYACAGGILMCTHTLYLHLPVNFRSVVAHAPAPVPNACDFKCGFKCELGLDWVFLPVRGLIHALIQDRTWRGVGYAWRMMEDDERSAGLSGACEMMVPRVALV